MKYPRGELFCSGSSEIFLCLTAPCSWLILKISFWIAYLLGCLTGCPPSARSDDPLPLSFTPVDQKHQSPQGIPRRPGTEKGGRKKTQDLIPKILMGCIQASSDKRWNSTLLTFFNVSFFQVVSVLSVRLYLLSLCQHYLFLSDWEGNMTDRLQTQGQLLPLAIFGARVSWETGASSQYTGVVMDSGDIWGRRCSPTASSVWGINISMTCSVWMFPSSPVGQGQLMSSLLWQVLREAGFICCFRAKMLKTWPTRAALF